MDRGGSEALSWKARRILPWQRQKINNIVQALNSDPVDMTALRELATSRGGLLHPYMRRRAWPKLAGVNRFETESYEGPSLESLKDRAQVVLDVNRCTRRIPPDYSESAREEVKEQLTRVILRLLAENNALHYYQGLHDIVITLLLVLGEELCHAVMEALVTFHIRDYLDKDMTRTKDIIAYLRPLLYREDSELELFITRSECEYYFSLSWLITWYGHVARTPEESFRLMDVFLASHPLQPAYVAAAIVLDHRSEILSLECEMSAVHGLLSKLPETVDYEEMVTRAVRLYREHPPSQLARTAGVKPSSSTLISSHPTFLRLARSQRPDHVLIHLPKKPKKHSWWLSWRPSFPRSAFVFKLLSLGVVAPVILAMAVYCVQFWLRRTRGFVGV